MKRNFLLLNKKNSNILEFNISSKFFFSNNNLNLGDNNMCNCKQRNSKVVKMYGMEFDLSTPKGCYEYAVEVLEGPWEEGLEAEDIILESTHYTFMYLKDVKGSWDKGEEVISKCPTHSFFYVQAMNNNQPWEKGEDAISTDPMMSRRYAKEIIGGRWEKGEKAISKSSIESKYYAVQVLRDRFLKGEARIKREYNDTFKHIYPWKEYKAALLEIGVVVED
jgi:hypothetical protein